MDYDRDHDGSLNFEAFSFMGRKEHEGHVHGD